MFTANIENVIKAVEAKTDLMQKSIFRYLLAAGLAGAYVGLGIILIFSVGAPFFASGSPATFMVMGMSFGIALTLVIFAGSELFTGNNMLYTISSLSGHTTWGLTMKNWVLVFIGNLLGALALSGLVYGSGIFGAITENHLLYTSAAKKMNMDVVQLFFRGILCNWLVCLAIWTSMKAKEDIAKLVLIWWMLYAFIASGYEHSIANMTLLSLAYMLPNHPETITLAGWFHNMIPVTLGNMVGGGLFVGTIYWLISPVRKNSGK